MSPPGAAGGRGHRPGVAQTLRVGGGCGFNCNATNPMGSSRSSSSSLHPAACAALLPALTPACTPAHCLFLLHAWGGLADVRNGEQSPSTPACAACTACTLVWQGHMLSHAATGMGVPGFGSGAIPASGSLPSRHVPGRGPGLRDSDASGHKPKAGEPASLNPSHMLPAGHRDPGPHHTACGRVQAGGLVHGAR